VERGVLAEMGWKGSFCWVLEPCVTMLMGVCWLLLPVAASWPSRGTQRTKVALSRYFLHHHHDGSHPRSGQPKSTGLSSGVAWPDLDAPVLGAALLAAGDGVAAAAPHLGLV
jgi:hypothetical protein